MSLQENDVSDRSVVYRESSDVRHHNGASSDSAPIAHSHSQPDDCVLLEQFRGAGCTESFQAIVARHKGWIYSLAKRHVKDRHLAEDVVQAVFIVLAKKAGTIPSSTPLAAWLFRVARFAANDVIKRESRGRRRIDRAAEHVRSKSTANGNGDASSVDVDEALACVGEADRQVILLRFYEDMSMAEIGSVLGINEQAAKKRVSRAVMRLREVLGRQGHALSATAILTLLLQTTQEAQAGSAVVIGAISTPSKLSMTVAQSTMKLLTGAKTRLLAALAGTSVVLVLGVSSISSVMAEVVQPVWNAIEQLIWSPAPAPVVSPAPPKQSSTPATPQPTASNIWVGRAGGMAMPITPQAAANPVNLQRLPINTGAVAVIEDSFGQVWYRPIDEELLPPSQSVEAKTYEQLNPHAVFQFDRVIREVLETSVFPVREDPGDWRALRYSEDGLLFPMETNIQFVDNGLRDGSPVIPEPMLLSLAAAGIGLLARPRRAKMRECR